jgi:hypothetical protein
VIGIEGGRLVGVGNAAALGHEAREVDERHQQWRLAMGFSHVATPVL